MTPLQRRRLSSLRSRVNEIFDEILGDAAPVVKANKIRTPEYSKEDKDAANYLLQLVQTNMTYVKTPSSMLSWYDAIHKLHNIDKYDYAIITAVIEWCQNDHFWRTNIRSAPKLREKFETLLASIHRERDNSPL